MQWGDEQRLRELFGDAAAALTVVRREFLFRYESAQHWIDVFRAWYGPVRRAFEALDAAGQRALEADIADLLARLDRGGGAGLVVPGEYVEAVVVRR
jgi:ketosteroid isomerase-like protein